MKKEHLKSEVKPEESKVEKAAAPEVAAVPEAVVPEVAAAPQADAGKVNFNIMRIYAKDLSFETPNSPAIFQEKWEPKVALDLDVKTNKLENDLHEVVLKVTVTVKNGEKTAFLAEAATAGIFLLQGIKDGQLRYMLGSFCPNMLFPYARETISDVVVRGGFPPLYLAPINFDALLEQQVKKQ